MKITKYVITKFEPKEIKEEHLPCSKLIGGKEEILYKPREPSEFEGKTIAIKTSGILYDKEELKTVINNLTEGYSCDCQGGDCCCCAVITYKNKLLKVLQ